MAAVALTLEEAEPGRALVVESVDPSVVLLLAQEGIDAGVEATVERRIGLGGPLIVRLGRARLALARHVAGQVAVRPAQGRDG